MSKKQANDINKTFKSLKLKQDSVTAYSDSVIKSLAATQLELKVSKAVENDVWYYSTMASGWFFILAFLTAINH
jgi:cell division protein FtsL